MLTAPNLADLPWLEHGFGMRHSTYPPGIVTVKQIHSAIVAEAPFVGEADALVSANPGTLIGVRTADCVPILIADPRTRAVAAIHSGWRGSAANIVSAAVLMLISRHGVRPADLHAAIGPAIGPCCYEVSAEVARRFATWFPDLAQTDQATRIDLPAIVERQLFASGLINIWRANQCTFCEGERYYSFRREKDGAGRMISFIGQVETILKGET